MAVSTAVIIPIIVVAAVIVIVAAFTAMWRVAEPNEALIISGLRDKGIAKDTSGDEAAAGRTLYVTAFDVR